MLGIAVLLWLGLHLCDAWDCSFVMAGICKGSRDSMNWLFCTHDEVLVITTPATTCLTIIIISGYLILTISTDRGTVNPTGHSF